MYVYLYHCCTVALTWRLGRRSALNEEQEHLLLVEYMLKLNVNMVLVLQKYIHMTNGEDINIVQMTSTNITYYVFYILIHNIQNVLMYIIIQEHYTLIMMLHNI